MHAEMKRAVKTFAERLKKDPDFPWYVATGGGEQKTQRLLHEGLAEVFHPDSVVIPEFRDRDFGIFTRKLPLGSRAQATVEYKFNFIRQSDVKTRVLDAFCQLLHGTGLKGYRSRARKNSRVPVRVVESEHMYVVYLLASLSSSEVCSHPPNSICGAYHTHGQELHSKRDEEAWRTLCANVNPSRFEVLDQCDIGEIQVPPDKQCIVQYKVLLFSSTREKALAAIEQDVKHYIPRRRLRKNAVVSPQSDLNTASLVQSPVRLMP